MRLPSLKCDVSIEMKGERVSADSEVIMSAKVRFTAEQVAYLERLFPEITSMGMSYGELQYNTGQRSVLAHLKTLSNIGVQIVEIQGNSLPRR